ncbi:restriction endonuclease [Oenococcus sicerae]|uniref:Restriction endonuclease n=1 Tax=Oenococcus sicerae TaxID=2203724 RepID=A0AAJ1RB65_9LACO|nr:restriction endonuclease [Oenococcus sicerae]MDN6900403.1 restriction endonuclease [Oenococcus sicerae]
MEENHARTNNIKGLDSTDIHENLIRTQMPTILEILLIDRTTSTSKKAHNIIWGNENYLKYNPEKYAATAEIKPELITGMMEGIIKPRALKTEEIKKKRTKSKAEVFTPTWIVKKQNDSVDKNFTDDDLETYVKRTWLEITCGEAPYMATRYDMNTGQIIDIGKRVGFVDRKLIRINKEINDKAEWQQLVEEAYKASYGFEWNGDSLLLARENLLYTYRDYYFEKWHEEPFLSLFKTVSEIISYNVFQMDGLKYIVPLTEKREKVIDSQMSLFEDNNQKEKWTIKPGKRVKIVNWETNKMEFFDKGVK